MIDMFPDPLNLDTLLTETQWEYVNCTDSKYKALCEEIQKRNKRRSDAIKESST